MLTISLDMGDVPSVLEAMRDPRLAQKAVNATAESYVTDTLDWIAAGKGFTPRHGGAGLEGAITWRGNHNGTAIVEADKDYAPYVEFGTGPHVIRPAAGRKGVKMPVSGGGGYVIGREYTHPGSKPHPFFFVDRTAREERMTEKAISVLEAHMNSR